MKNFLYRKPSTLEEVFALLSEYQEGALVYAGGTVILPKMKQKLLQPEILIDIKGIKGLEEIRGESKKGFTLGALATLRSLEVSWAIQERGKVIAEAAGMIGSIQNRNSATLGGNLCYASPSAEMAPCLIALGATARIVSKEGERSVSLQEFFAGPGKTVLQKGELLGAIQVPPPPVGLRCVYQRLALRKAMDLPVVMVAVSLILDPGGGKRCDDIKIVLGAVAPVPMRARKAEERLRGQEIDSQSIQEAAEIAAAEAHPVNDLRASSDYRREMVRILSAQSIKEAAA